MMKKTTLIVIQIAAFAALTLAIPHPSAFCQQNCPSCRVGRWQAVDHSMIKRTVKQGVSLVYQQVHGKLIINATVTKYGCTKPGSGAITYISGDWTHIAYTQEFRGYAACWKVFGKTSYPGHSKTFGFGYPPQTNDVEDFSAVSGDPIFNQHKMKSDSDDIFDGITYRCEDTKNNFWYSLNGEGLRSATVMLRRGPNGGDAGISTETSCGTPYYVIKDIYVYIY